MNNKGFTLVELLATIIILGLVTTIGVVSTTVIMENVKEKTKTILEKNVAEAIESYISENASSLRGKTYNDPNEIKVSELINNGYISDIKIDDKKCYDNDTKFYVYERRDDNTDIFEKFYYTITLNQDCDNMEIKNFSSGMSNE